jgi:hypothetical protein
VNELPALQKAVTTLERAAKEADASLKADLAAKEAAKKERSPFDKLEDKITASTAVAAAAAGSPEQARAMLASARGKMMQAAADGADTAALEAMVRDLERLAKIAEEKRDQKNLGGDDSSAAAIPTIVAIARS